jgi:hypothetical protein
MTRCEFDIVFPACQCKEPAEVFYCSKSRGEVYLIARCKKHTLSTPPPISIEEYLIAKVMES